MVKKERFDREDFDSLIRNIQERNDYFSQEEKVFIITTEDKEKLKELKQGKKLRLN